ncbi:hypothetical protein F0344_24620 [Streptomyces finlayi]|uniref:Secreted protein n=1 Tax=Streptomyces finlayi TaxID=67296 RepID=A0A7G7BPT9_9ACTN|nr:hypothetical protein [Streptomyces finlayi]QNE77354.1 hypothetical protein F0344_24620 [Streptomyces finlayi]
MRRRTMRIGAALIGVTTALLGANSALGSTVYTYQGDDYAYIKSDHEAVGVCDREIDGSSVYTNYYRSIDSDYRRVEETRGFGTCTSSGSSGNLVWKIRACENITALPDACSSWKTHY